MGWEEHFRKLIHLKQKHEDREKQQKKEKIAADLQIAKEIGPQIERVCKGFAKAVGWQYEKIGDFYFECHSRVYSDGSGPTFKFLVSPEHDAIWVHFYSNSDRCENESRAILLNEFTEEKLAKIFEDLAEKCGLIM